MNIKGFITKTIVFATIVGIAYYVWLPPINYQAVDFWIFLGMVVLLAMITYFGAFKRHDRIIRLGNVEKIITYYAPQRAALRILTVVGIFAVVLIVAGSISTTPILHSKTYANLIDKKEGNFSQDIKEVPWERIPTVDRDSAVRLGNRKMGEVVSLVSQFTVSEEYSQINYQGRPVRVSPLQYASLIKWITNSSQGIPYYMQVNMVDGKTELTKASSPIRYSKSERLNRDITRHLRFHFPMKLFYQSNFEIDEKGIPYWITPVYKMRVGLFGGPDVKEVILTNAEDGSSKVFPVEEAPEWIDRVYDADLIINQVNWNGKFQSGFINSIIGQKGVLMPTDGYNYLALEDDVYLYTGLTSVSSDASNIGFILVNMRTKSCDFYSVPSAEEFSAMESAQGAVQEKGYKATFPLLLNINGRPTYFLSLKDQAGLIKMYAFIDAQDYQYVVTAGTVSEAYKNFASKAKLTTEDKINEDEIKTFTGKISNINSIVVEGNSIFYFLLENEKTVFIAPSNLSSKLPLAKTGDEVLIEYVENSDGSAKVLEIKMK